MKIKTVEYLGSYAVDQALPDTVGPEFVFIGRSNVGKSSLINTLVGRKNIARTSNTPGKTRTANFYPVNGELCFVDMPGYGYAQVSKKERHSWTKLMRQYLEDRDSLKGVVHLLDARHAPSKEDREMAAILAESGHPVCLIFTKVDKVKKAQVDRKIAGHIAVLTANEDTGVVPFSAETGEGRRALWSWMEAVLAA